MFLINKVFSSVSIFIFCFCNFCSCQVTKQSSVKDGNLLKGYFILYRSEILQKDADNIQPREFYNIFYVKELTQEILVDFIHRDSFQLNIFSISKPWGLISPDSEKRRDSIYQIVEKYTTFTDMLEYNFFDTKRITTNIINSNDRFMAVYKGQLATIGPFTTTNSTPKVRQTSYGYFYLRDERNTLEYLYTIILPSEK